MEHTKLKLLPVKFEQESSIFSNWVLPHELNAPKPRNIAREQEVPPEDLSLSNLPNILPFVEVLPAMVINSGKEIRQVASSAADVLIVTNGQDDIIRLLTQLGKFILPQWDNWGYIWNIRHLPARDVYTFIPFGAQEVKSVLRAIYARKFLGQLRAIYFGEIPSHTVFDAFYDLEGIRRRFGTVFIHQKLEDYVSAVQDIDDQDSHEIGKKWEQIYQVENNRVGKLGKYGRIYLGLKDLLKKKNANALTIDCAALPSADFVPCFSVSLLIDEGYVWACEGDISALLAMAILIGISQKPAIMGNIFENNTHQDIEKNIIVLNHDIAPPSMSCEGCPIVLHDFHGTGKGLTGYVELETGRKVTLLSLNQTAAKMQIIQGEIAWTENTVHCRIAIGIKVQDAKRIIKEIEGHHPAMVYGDFMQPLEVLGKVLKIETIKL